jgi:DNA adenine methylase
VKITATIKSPLRYPGGKSKAIPQILPYLPKEFSEYREPFVGGGSLFVHLAQTDKELKFWINDLNEELFLFWKVAQADLDTLVEQVRRMKLNYQDGRKLFEELTQVDSKTLSELERASRFFVLNRITFSGTVESGGYSEQAFHKRFTVSSIDRLSELGKVLETVQITNLDYSNLLTQKGENVFIFLDPPYFSATSSKLYGKKGNLHLSFDHDRFAKLLKDCSHQWLITYDDSPKIRKNFEFANIYTWEFQYGMNNYKQITAAKGKELFITNYEIQPFSEVEQLVLTFVN